MHIFYIQGITIYKSLVLIYLLMLESLLSVEVIGYWDLIPICWKTVEDPVLCTGMPCNGPSPDLIGNYGIPRDLQGLNLK